jgi:hypothetical protein
MVHVGLATSLAPNTLERSDSTTDRAASCAPSHMSRTSGCNGVFGGRVATPSMLRRYFQPAGSGKTGLTAIQGIEFGNMGFRNVGVRFACLLESLGSGPESGFFRCALVSSDVHIGRNQIHVHIGRNQIQIGSF